MILQGFKLFLLLRYRFLLCIILSIKLVIEGEKMTKLYGSVEAGGTKFVCAVGDENFQVVEKVQFPTTTPYETIDKTVAFFKRFSKTDLVEELVYWLFWFQSILMKIQKLTAISQPLQNHTGLMLTWLD